jgi:hypothetical protein
MAIIAMNFGLRLEGGYRFVWSPPFRDHLMPGLTGAELVRKIKMDHHDMPIILIPAVNEIPRGAEFADLFMSKLDGPVFLTLPTNLGNRSAIPTFPPPCS